MRIQNHFPWYCQSPDMRSNLLVMCKLLWLLLVINGIWAYFSDPFIPFIRFLDAFRLYPGIFRGLLMTVFLGGGLGLLFNYRVREMTIILGLGILLFLLASKPAFRNHLFICACIFLLCGLSEKHREPWLLYTQMSLIYFGAALNKIWQLDWWNGQFMHNWLFNARDNAIYKGIHDLLPAHLTDHLFSLASICIELSIALLLLSKKRHKTAVWIILIFHTVLYTITGFRFGHFFEDIVIFLLVFLAIPDEPIQIWYRSKRSRPPALLLRFMDWNRQFRFIRMHQDADNWLQVGYTGHAEYNARALGKLVLYSPATYFGLLLADTAVRGLLNVAGEHLVTAGWLWAGILINAWLWLWIHPETPKASFKWFPDKRQQDGLND